MHEDRLVLESVIVFAQSLDALRLQKEERRRDRAERGRHRREHSTGGIERKDGSFPASVKSHCYRKEAGREGIG